jgi:hypothetical protein
MDAAAFAFVFPPALRDANPLRIHRLVDGAGTV